MRVFVQHTHWQLLERKWTLKKKKQKAEPLVLMYTALQIKKRAKDQ